MKICKHKWLPALWPRLSEFERETYSIYADRSLESDDRWVGIRVARGLLGYWLCSITWAEMVVLQLCSVQIIIWAIRSCFVHFSVASFLNRKIIGNRKKKDNWNQMSELSNCNGPCECILFQLHWEWTASSKHSVTVLLWRYKVKTSSSWSTPLTLNDLYSKPRNSRRLIVPYLYWTKIGSISLKSNFLPQETQS